MFTYEKVSPFQGCNLLAMKLFAPSSFVVDQYKGVGKKSGQLPVV